MSLLVVLVEVYFQLKDDAIIRMFGCSWCMQINHDWSYSSKEIHDVHPNMNSEQRTNILCKKFQIKEKNLCLGKKSWEIFIAFCSVKMENNLGLGEQSLLKWNWTSISEIYIHRYNSKSKQYLKYFCVLFAFDTVLTISYIIWNNIWNIF